MDPTQSQSSEPQSANKPQPPAAGQLAGKVAVVTGSTSGIGAAIARGLAGEGAAVVVSGRRAERGREVVEAVERTGGRAIFQQADVIEPDDCRRLIDGAAEAFGGLDVLVNNAGIFPRQSFEQTDAAFWDRMFNINVRGAMFCCQAAVPWMRQRGGGSIINIGTINHTTFSDQLFAYGVSKGALYMMTRRLAGMLRRDRIRVNWVTVGWVLTEQEIDIQGGEGELPRLHQREKELPMGQFNVEEDYARACIYLAGPGGERITGMDFNVSAGLHISL